MAAPVYPSTTSFNPLSFSPVSVPLVTKECSPLALVLHSRLLSLLQPSLFYPHPLRVSLSSSHPFYWPERTVLPRLTVSVCATSTTSRAFLLFCLLSILNVYSQINRISALGHVLADHVSISPNILSNTLHSFRLST